MVAEMFESKRLCVSRYSQWKLKILSRFSVKMGEVPEPEDCNRIMSRSKLCGHACYLQRAGKNDY